MEQVCFFGPAAANLEKSVENNHLNKTKELAVMIYTL